NHPQHAFSPDPQHYPANPHRHRIQILEYVLTSESQDAKSYRFQVLLTLELPLPDGVECVGSWSVRRVGAEQSWHGSAGVPCGAGSLVGRAGPQVRIHTTPTPLPLPSPPAKCGGRGAMDWARDGDLLALRLSHLRGAVLLYGAKSGHHCSGPLARTADMGSIATSGGASVRVH